MSAKEKRKRGGGGKYKIFLPLTIVLGMLGVAATIASQLFGAQLDSFLGAGKRRIVNASNTEGWDTAYYERRFETDQGPEGSQYHGGLVSEEISDEGIVLLKNNGALPLAGTEIISPFGYGYLNALISPGGISSAVEENGEYLVSLQHAMEERFAMNPAALEVLRKAERGGKAIKTEVAEHAHIEWDVAGQPIFSDAIEGSPIPEYPLSIYDEAKSSYAGTVGLVLIRRFAGENGDAANHSYTDGTPHYLALSEAEKATIRYAKENCEKMVVVLNTSSQMEIAELTEGELEADAILWVGMPGGRGFLSLAKILAGEVNPSGRLADTYARDLTRDPTFVNYSVNAYDGIRAAKISFMTALGIHQVPAYFLEYEEGIYVGYRYYETASDIGAINYEEEVTYPFGYGLSYTSFEQSILEERAEGDEILVDVKVKNTGSIPGKEVVQLYFTPPYTDLDQEYEIEKSAVNLIAFAKTGIIPPGGEEKITLTFPIEEMASYCAAHGNADGSRGCYMLEAGEYLLSLRANSHEVIETRTFLQQETIWYDGSDARHIRQSDRAAQSSLKAGTEGGAAGEDAAYAAATNRFEDLSAYMAQPRVTRLTRKDGFASMPTAPTAEDKIPTQEIIDGYAMWDLDKFDYGTNPLLSNEPASLVYCGESATERKENGLTAADLRGAEYDSALWEDLLDQLDYDQVTAPGVFYGIAYSTGAIESIALPATVDYDGPGGLRTMFSTTPLYYCAYACENLLAATWNVELARKMGEAVAQEALTTGVEGWYGPACNIHRSPFNGRNYEYFSEDPLISGRMVTAETSGASDNGLIVWVKHFALNNMETNRQGVAVWATEQTVREIYLRAFEICVKNARCTVKYIADEKGNAGTKTLKSNFGIMTSMNRIGYIPAGGSWQLITGILRNEWGFTGAIVTDTPVQTHRDNALRAGSDLVFGEIDAPMDTTSPTARQLLRESVHRVAYLVANSSAMQNKAPGTTFAYGMAPWRIGLAIGQVAMGGWIVAMAAWIVIRKWKISFARKT